MLEVNRFALRNDKIENLQQASMNSVSITELSIENICWHLFFLSISLFLSSGIKRQQKAIINANIVVELSVKNKFEANLAIRITQTGIIKRRKAGITRYQVREIKLGSNTKMSNESDYWHF